MRSWAALPGTPSQAALYTFSTDTPAVNAGPIIVADVGCYDRGVNRFKALYRAGQCDGQRLFELG